MKISYQGELLANIVVAYILIKKKNISSTFRPIIFVPDFKTPINIRM
jgi:hypothetical protein